MQLDCLHIDITEGKAIHIAALLALGVGVPTIAKMLKIPQAQVQKLAQKDLPEKPNARPRQGPVAPAPTPAQVSVDDYMRFIEPHEGRRYAMYQDTVGVPTIGVGFNLRRNDAQQLLTAVGADYQQIMAGGRLNDAQIDGLLRHTTQEAERNARALVNNFDTLPPNVKLVLVDMSFNFGNRLAGFHNMINAINNSDFAGAADAMVDSRWYNQVGHRGPALERLMRAAAN